jgi:hypothetical protein
MTIDRGSLDHGVAGSAVPGGVSAAVTEAGDVTDEHLVSGQGVTVGGSVWATSVTHLPLVVRTRSPSIFGRVAAAADMERPPPPWGWWSGPRETPSGRFPSMRVGISGGGRARIAAIPAR